MPGPGGGGVPGLGEGGAWSRGVPALGGVPAPGGCLVPWGCLHQGGAWSWGGAWSGGVPAPGGACFGGMWYPACTEADPPVNRMTDRCKNITFATSLRTVKICIYLSHPFFLKNLSVFQIKIQKSKKNSVHNFVSIYVCVFRSKFS